MRAARACVTPLFFSHVSNVAARNTNKSRTKTIFANITLCFVIFTQF